MVSGKEIVVVFGHETPEEYNKTLDLLAVWVCLFLKRLKFYIFEKPTENKTNQTEFNYYSESLLGRSDYGSLQISEPIVTCSLSTNWDNNRMCVYKMKIDAPAITYRLTANVVLRSSFR